MHGAHRFRSLGDRGAEKDMIDVEQALRAHIEETQRIAAQMQATVRPQEHKPGPRRCDDCGAEGEIELWFCGAARFCETCIDPGAAQAGYIVRGAS